MGKTINVALIQQHAEWDVKNNLDRGIKAFEEAAQNGAQLIAYSELAFIPFYPQKPARQNNLDLAEPVPGPTTEIFQALAKKHHVVTVLNLFEKDGDKTYDSSPIIDADGHLLGTTRMHHIVEAPFFHEQGYYAFGEGSPLVFKTAIGKVGVAICYDRHFPEYMRVLRLQGAELVVIPQAGGVDEWPEGLYEAELQVASFQNGYFTALCNRVGKEELITFEGKSFVVAPDGRIISQSPALKDEILYAEIDLDEVKTSHASKHFIPDRREGIYKKWFGG